MNHTQIKSGEEKSGKEQNYTEQRQPWLNKHTKVADGMGMSSHSFGKSAKSTASKTSSSRAAASVSTKVNGKWGHFLDTDDHNDTEKSSCVKSKHTASIKSSITNADSKWGQFLEDNSVEAESSQEICSEAPGIQTTLSVSDNVKWGQFS